MITPLDELRSKREAGLAQRRQIDHLRRGSLSQQFFKKHQDGKVIEAGPYYVLQCFYQGGKCSERIPASEAPAVQRQVDNFRLFQKLADDFVNLSEQLTQLERAAPGSKTNFKARNSPTSSATKPKGS